jgi:hypothetical protein
LKLLSFSTAPKRARAGRRLTATLALVDENGADLLFHTPNCRASVDARALRATDAGFVDNRVRCSWSLPKSAKGKVLRGTISVESCGSTIARRFTRRVR